MSQSPARIQKSFRKIGENVIFGQTQSAYEFGPFRVDSRERQLLRDGKQIPLRPKAFDLLLLLLQNRGRLLSKDEVMKRVWSNATVEEGNIARTVSTLRIVLGEGPREHRYIETVPWRGYRFVAQVKELQDPERLRPIESIAVLPFTNVTEDQTNEYLADGIAESLIIGLAQLTSLRVISRNSTFRYKGRKVDAQTVGRELKVQAVLFGRVGMRNDLLSISVELVETADDRHIWGAQFIRKASDLFEIQETIAKEIVARFGLTPMSRLTQSARRHTSSNDAYLLYLKGRYHFNKLTPDAVQKAIEYFNQAIKIDSLYALAYVGLGDCHNYLAHREEAKKALQRALELDETLGEAHASLGFFRFLYDWDFAGAEQEFKRALVLSPSYAEAHHWYAIYLANLGRYEDAEPYALRAVDLDPLSMLMNMTPALNFYMAREYERAIEELEKILEMEPGFMAARSVKGNVLVKQGRYEEAMTEYEGVLESLKGAVPVEISVKAIMAQAFARWGKRDEALKLLEEVIAAGTASPYSVAGIYGALAESGPAFELLNQAVEQHDVQLVSLMVDPSLDEMRSDPRFSELIERVGLTGH